MNRRTLVSWGTAAVLLLGAAPARAADGAMPPDPERIATALVKRGAIPRSATPEQRDAALEQYLQAKLRGADKQGNALARKGVDANENALLGEMSLVRGKKLGVTTDVAPSKPQWRPLTGSDKLLLILVEFSDQSFTWTDATGRVRTETGPLHNKIPAPDNSYDLWVPDFSNAHYEDMLFTPGGWTVPAGAMVGQHRGSMADYYLAQSFGQYTVEGQAYGWFQVDKPEAYYGDDDPNGGNDDLPPGDVRHDLIGDAVAKANAVNAIPWADYDSDGDCVIDHPLFIHAGSDQSGGGGAQGDDAIWAHSWSTWVNVAPPTATCPSGLFIYNYTIMPEDGGVGVFAHEFGHDLGLPDEYDTIYSGRGASTANWSIMSQGSWLGQPAQTEPSDMSIWARWALGWLGGKLGVAPLGALSSTPVQARLEQSERWGGTGTLNAVAITLPDQIIALNTPYAGAQEWWGGKSDERDATLTRTVDLTGRSGATLSFWTWYDLEESWDFAFVQVSTDGGATWTSLPIDGTTSGIEPGGYPAIQANLPGFTGSSHGWVRKTADLGAYAGRVIQLQFRYMTDWGTTGPGFYVDEIALTADGATLFADGAEALDPAWTATGFTRSNGTLKYPHFYMAEWRNLAPLETPWSATSIVNFDTGLNHATQYDAYGSTGNPDEPWYYGYSPGLVLWYRNYAYGENWTGTHPGHGFLLVVDARAQPIYRPAPGVGSYPWNTHIQAADSAFSLERAVDNTIGFYGMTRSYQGLAAQPVFDDRNSYWDFRTPGAGVMTPKLGLTFRVLGEAADGSAAVIGIAKQ